MKSIAEQIAYYSQRLDEGGPDWRVADWGSEDTQRIRHEVLLAVAPRHFGYTFLDVGCGVGTLADSIGGSYEGWDICLPMIEKARRLRTGSRRRFLVRDLVDSTEWGKFDYVMASGLFTYSDITFFWRAIRRMWELSRIAVAFNVLSQLEEGVKTHAGEFRADLGKTAEYCLLITPRVTLRHDYLNHDFTVYMYRYA